MSFVSRWVESVGGWFGGTEGRENEESDTEAEPREESQASLFQCPDCEAVYVATQKDTCSTCGTSVDEIPSVLAETE